MELQTTTISPKGRRIIPVQKEGEEEEEEAQHAHKVLGCIPQNIHGDFGCICRPLSFIKYWINPTVMVSSIIIIWAFVIWCAVDTENASEKIGDAQTFVVRYFGWFYISSLVIFSSFAIYFMCSSFGDIKLGPADEEPKYSLITWFSMLFSAGMGGAIYFFGVAEPVLHLNDMQRGFSRWYDLTTNEQAMQALNLSWFHCGFTASATYCAAALPLAYHYHVKNEPLRESVCLISLIGEKYANGIIGCLIDLTSVIGTMCGVATSLGFGVLSINSGLKFIFGIDENLTVQLIILWVITAFATISVLTGLDFGIRRLSEINFAFSFFTLFLMFFAFDPLYLLNLFIQGIGYHFQSILELTFNTQAFEQCGFYDKYESNEAQVTWMSSWTVFYWAWWIAWAPFVGIFIAQISRGRTIREFIIGNMMVPTIITCIWLTIFGGIGLYNELGSIQNEIECDSNNESEWFSEYNGNKIVKLSCYAIYDMLFATYNTLPYGVSTIISILSIIAILMYFVTSSDSASHVIDILTAGGHTQAPKLQRVFWALSEGAVASVLLVTGGGGSESLNALQTASLVAALPFCVVLLFEVMATYKTLCIHMGYINISEMVYWEHDLFECGTYDQFPHIFIAAICPPYYQMKTRLKIDFEFHFKYIWICAFWMLWFLSILFIIFEFAFGMSGFFQFGVAFYLFYIILCCINRGNIKEYYEINSSHIIFDICSWVFCCCCAAIQEDLQSNSNCNFNQDIELKINVQIEKAKANDNNNEYESESVEQEEEETDTGISTEKSSFISTV